MISFVFSQSTERNNVDGMGWDDELSYLFRFSAFEKVVCSFYPRIGRLSYNLGKDKNGSDISKNVFSKWRK